MCLLLFCSMFYSCVHNTQIQNAHTKRKKKIPKERKTSKKKTVLQHTQEDTRDARPKRSCGCLNECAQRTACITRQEHYAFIASFNTFLLTILVRHSVWQNRIEFDSGCPTWEMRQKRYWMKTNAHAITRRSIRSVCLSSVHKHTRAHTTILHCVANQNLFRCFFVSLPLSLNQNQCTGKQNKNTPGSLVWISSMLISLHDDVDLEDMTFFLFLFFFSKLPNF